MWLKFVGDGSCIEISADLSEFNTIVAVFVGFGCDELHCVNEHLQSSFGESKNIEIQTRAGLSYFVFVAGQFSRTIDYGVTFSRKPECGEKSFCTICADGNIPNRSLSFDGESCQEIEKMAAFAEIDSNDCALANIAGATACGCPTNIFLTGICTICPDGSDPTNKDLPIFGSEGDASCSSWSRVAAVDGNTTCDLIQSRSYYCGCKGVEGCEFCPNGAPPKENLSLPFGIFRTEARYVTYLMN